MLRGKNIRVNVIQLTHTTLHDVYYIVNDTFTESIFSLFSFLFITPKVMLAEN